MTAFDQAWRVVKSDPDYPVDEHGDELEPCWSCNKWVVNEANAVGQVDEGDYDPYICPECGKKPENAEHLWDDNQSCLQCGKGIHMTPGTELGHYHGHTMDTMTGPYCNQDCWIASNKYDPEHGYREVSE